MSKDVSNVLEAGKAFAKIEADAQLVIDKGEKIISEDFNTIDALAYLAMALSDAGEQVVETAAELAGTVDGTTEKDLEVFVQGMALKAAELWLAQTVQKVVERIGKLASEED